MRTKQYARSAGDAPNIGRVARVPGTGLPKGSRRERRRSDRRGRSQMQRVHRRHVLITWSVVLFLLAVAVLGFFLWSWLRAEIGRREAVADTGRPALERRKASKFASPSEDQALDLVKRALALRNENAVPQYFRTGMVQPAEVLKFLTAMETNDGPVTGYQWLSSVDANGLLLDGVLVSTVLNDKPRNRLALLTPDETGVWKIDFEAFARTVRPPWEKLLSEDGGSGMVRVIVARDSYYNGPFRDDQEWVCYGMASPDTEVILLGYARKDSPQAQAMERMFPKDDDSAGDLAAKRRRMVIRATLELNRPPEADRRQFEITRVLAEDWVLSGVPFDSMQAGSTQAPPADRSQ